MASFKFIFIALLMHMFIFSAGERLPRKLARTPKNHGSEALGAPVAFDSLEAN